MINLKVCPICEQMAEIQSDVLHSSIVTLCDRCGRVGLTEELNLMLGSAKYLDARMKIAHLATEKRLKSEGYYILTDGVDGIRDNIPLIKLDTFLRKYPKSSSEILDRALLNLSRMTKHPSDRIPIRDTDQSVLFSSSVEGMLYILRQFSNSNYITPTSSVPCTLSIESGGWQRIEELQGGKATDYKQAFVAMWFDEKMTEVFEEGVRPAIEADGITTAFRIDLSEHNNKICDQIIIEIKRSKFMVADFTGNRGGVYYEAGFAGGLGIPVIWTVHEDELDDVHFDTRQYNHIVYSSPEELRQKLQARILATIPTSS